jgi:hypothetical protein
VTTDLSVKTTDRSVQKTFFGQLEHKPNFPLGQQILFFVFFHVSTLNEVWSFGWLDIWIDIAFGGCLRGKKREYQGR